MATIYSETITANKTWTCPKSGIYKVICVGGGGAGSAKSGTSSSTVEANGEAGKTTSFGSYLSAKGGASGGSGFKTKEQYHGGEPINGFNGAAVYGEVCFGVTTGCGYGASGGAFNKDSSFCSAGQPGEVKSAIISFQKGDTATCTIGAGGAAGTLTTTASALACSFGGAAGAIFIQYIGESL